jgi:Cu-processing system ATP-binding protein
MIEVHGLHKSWGAVTALAGIDAVFPAGSVTGIIGPNSAGKTTLLKCVLGLVRPSAGTILLAGRKVTPSRSDHGMIGYMRQTPSLPANLTADELFRMLRTLRPDDAADESLIDELRLRPELNKPLRTLSGGTRQKVNAVMAFMFDPRVLILDEPTAGLDPVASRVVKQRVRRARDDGRTVLLTSHVISEQRDLADRLLLLMDGRVRFHGTSAELGATTDGDELEDSIVELLETAP